VTVLKRVSRAHLIFTALQNTYAAYQPVILLMVRAKRAIARSMPRTPTEGFDDRVVGTV